MKGIFLNGPNVKHIDYVLCYFKLCFFIVSIMMWIGFDLQIDWANCKYVKDSEPVCRICGKYTVHAESDGSNGVKITLLEK